MKTISMCFVIFLSIVNPSMARDFDQGDLEKAVKKGVKDGSLTLPIPTFIVDRRAKTYDFSLNCDLLSKNPTPLDYPIALQTLLQSLDKNKKKYPPFERKHRKQIEKIIKQQLESIDNFRGGRERLMGQLLLQDGSARKVLYDAVREYAKDHELTPTKRVKPCAATYFFVTIAANNGSTVYYMKLLKFVIEKHRSKELGKDTLADVSNWNTMPRKRGARRGDFSTKLAGSYMILVVDQGSKKSRKITVTSNSEYKF
jgi:hypothetical protein